MTTYQKAFLLRLIDSQIDLLMRGVTGMLPEPDIANPEDWHRFWKEEKEAFERFGQLYQARNLIQVMQPGMETY